MNIVDRVQLRLFLAELAHARVSEKDRHAEEAIRRAFERQPDAAYLLVQRVLQLEHALCITRLDDAAPRVAAAGIKHPERVVLPRSEAPWWLQQAATFAGVAFLARSAEYLIGPWY